MFGMSHATYAATFCVSTPDELQIALTTAASNGEDDEVQVVQGTYVGNFTFISGEEFDLSIEGGYTASCASRVVDPTNTVIDANSTGNVLALVSNNVVDFMIDGLTVQNGNATENSRSSNGGGLYSATAEGEVTLSNNLISGNKAKDHGSGVYIEGAATVTLVDNAITDNKTKKYNDGDGGGVYFGSSSTVTLTGNDINGNTANGNGGGVYFGSSSTVTLTGNDINGNSGGGVYFGSSSTVTLTGNDINGNSGGGVFFAEKNTGTLTDNVINGNTANNNNGGGVYFAKNSTVTLTSNVINGNAANYDGGGVYVNSSKTAILIINNVISANTVNGNGGGLYIQQPDTTILTNNTITSNMANKNGGGVWLKLKDDTDSADIYNNIIWNNNAVTQGNDLYINNDGNGNFTPSPLNLFNNDFDQSISGAYIAIPITIDPSNLNNLDPLFVDDGDYHLQAGSPCIDAGDNAAPSLPTTDKDGNPRIVNNIVDIGAYEQQVAADSYLQFSKAKYTVNENKNTVTITVTRTDGSNGAVSVDYATTDETATAGSDYADATGTLNWGDGDASKKTFTVDIIDDSEVEGDETLILSLDNVTGGAGLGEPNTAVLTITDDDSTPFNCKQVTEIPKNECKALIALYDSTDGENWLDNTGWNVTNSPCSWYGVSCRSKHVTGLSLGNNNLKGSISAKFLKLKNLESLVLSDNDLDGTSLNKFKKLKNLGTLLLNNCKLSGKIPNSLMKLNKLVELDLNDNCFSTKVSSKLKKWLDGLNPGWDETQTNCLY
jgi:parallel beta-helix repeat protein